MPKGEQLRGILEDLARDLGPGTLLPSERVLAERFGVSRTTLRQEVDRLVSGGVLFRRHGHGTFAAESKLGHVDLLTSFSRDMSARGLKPGAKVLSVAVEPAEPRTAGQLEVAPGSPVMRLERLRTADGMPMALERTNLSVLRFPGIADLDWNERSLSDELLRRWGTEVGAAESRITVLRPGAEDAALLQIDMDQSCLLIIRTARDSNGGVVEVGRSIYRGDQYDVTVRVERNHRR